MSIDREESLFLTVSENHARREYPVYVRRMSAPFREAGGMIAAYEGVVLGGGDRLFGLGELNLWEGDKIFLGLLAQDAPFFHLELDYDGDTLVRAELDGRLLPPAR